MAKAYSYVRMSTDAQLKGDSLRRQIARSEEFAQHHGLTLDRTFELKDIGLSAYDGSNIDKGQLGKFLQAVKKGQIEKGSYLIIESFDRLSRQKARSSLRLLLDLLDSGITIATLIDRRIYTPDSHDPNDLMMSLGIMGRAHDESLHKSERLSEAWKNKRLCASQKILTRLCKGWLIPHANGRGFDARPERVKIVEQIFQDAAERGMGADLIARRLNKRGVPTFGRSRGWHKSYVLKILRDRSVLGEFQPHSKIQGKRKPVGEPIPNYYPRIIEDDLFFRAQAALANRRQNGAGRKGARVTNLFSKVAYCGVSGHRMHLINKGAKGGRLLVCDGARRGLDCYVVPWKYDEFEKSFLTFIREADLSILAGDIQSDTKVGQFRMRSEQRKGASTNPGPGASEPMA